MGLKKERVSREYEVEFLKKIMQGRVLLPAVVGLIMFLLVFSVGGIFLATKVKEKTTGIMNVSAGNNENPGDSAAFDVNLSLNYRYEVNRGDEVEVVLKDLNNHVYLEGGVKEIISNTPVKGEHYKKIIVKINDIKSSGENSDGEIIKRIEADSNISVDVFVRSRQLLELFVGEKLRKLAGRFL